MALRTTTAQAALSSARQLNEHVLQIRLPHLKIAHLDALGGQRAQDLGHALVGVVHRQLQPPLALADAQNPVGAKGIGEPVQGCAAAALLCAISEALGGHYFNRTPVMIEYQGQTNKLFKRDFGRLFLEKFPVEVVDYGFLWGHVYDAAGFDDVTWWLFKKKQ